jgi:endonuclease I
VIRTIGLSVLLSVVFCPVRADSEYYDTVDITTPQALRNSLHVIIDDHTRFPYTSSVTDTWDVLEIADENQDNFNNIITIYRNTTYMKVHGGNNFYNREHTWPKSYGFPDNGPSLNYPYTDMHHLFLSDIDYNSNRSNKPYDQCDSVCQETARQVIRTITDL